MSRKPLHQARSLEEAEALCKKLALERKRKMYCYLVGPSLYQISPHVGPKYFGKAPIFGFGVTGNKNDGTKGQSAKIVKYPRGLPRKESHPVNAVRAYKNLSRMLAPPVAGQDPTSYMRKQEKLEELIKRDLQTYEYYSDGDD